MPESNVPPPKRRPVDLLFGEELETRVPVQPSAPSSAPALSPAPPQRERDSTPNYMVERPRPATVLRPPPPEIPADWRAHMQSVAAIEHVPASAPPPVNDAQMETPTLAAAAAPMSEVMPAASANVEMTVAPVFGAPIEEPISAPTIVPREAVSEEYNSLASLIDVLYQRVSEEASDSPTLSERCLTWLHDARAALEQNDYAQSEYKAEQVKARLLRARASLVAAESTSVKLIWGWEIFTGLVSVSALMLPFFAELVPGFVPLLRAVSLGALGGIMVSLWNLTHYLHTREYDTSYNADYWASPIKGGLIGGFVFFLSALGLVAAPGALGATRLFGSLSGANLLMYLLALLGGIGQDYIFEFVRRILAAVFRSPQSAPSASNSR